MSEGVDIAGNNARRHRRLAFGLASVALFMVGLSFAAVPLYRVFCQVTGFAGTTQRARSGADRVLDRVVTIRFDANVAKDLGWSFRPLEHTLDVKVGETKLAFYKAHNPTKRRLTGTATFNVTPEIAGGYFNKIECFCFTEQTLEPGQSVDMPVSFFIDPEIVNDPDAGRLDQITLSYTFFAVERDDKDIAQETKKQAGQAKGT